MLRRMLLLLALLFPCLSAQAVTLIELSGPAPFGFANQNPMVIAWHQNETSTNTSITMPLADLHSTAGVQGTVYLMNQIGLGTSPANEVAPPVSVSGLTGSFTPIALFSGLTLPAGDYYLVLVSTETDSLSMSPEGSSTPVFSLAQGVTMLGATSDLIPASYPPATNFSPLTQPGNLFMTITGDLAPAPVPTLSDWGGAALVLLVLVVGMTKRRRFSRHF